MTLKDLASFLKLFQKKSKQDKILIDRITNPLLDRANTIEELGLGYMTLYRQIGTLSGGEVQRIRLAKQLGNKLTGIVYVLDEPTI
jgi:excinuclease ABC subunit A